MPFLFVLIDDAPYELDEAATTELVTYLRAATTADDWQPTYHAAALNLANELDRRLSTPTVQTPLIPNPEELEAIYRVLDQYLGAYDDPSGVRLLPVYRAARAVS